MMATKTKKMPRLGVVILTTEHVGEVGYQWRWVLVSLESGKQLTDFSELYPSVPTAKEAAKKAQAQVKGNWYYYMPEWGAGSEVAGLITEQPPVEHR